MSSQLLIVPGNMFIRLITVTILSLQLSLSAGNEITSSLSKSRSTIATTTTTTTTSDGPYTYYPYYPEYCSTPEQMKVRSMIPPPLLIQEEKIVTVVATTNSHNDDGMEDETKTTTSNTQTISTTSILPTQPRLVHVTAVIRHGARTPTGGHKCWNGYWNNNNNDNSQVKDENQKDDNETTASSIHESISASKAKTDVWDCPKPRTIMALVRGKLDNTSDSDDRSSTPLVLFEKRYDAFSTHQQQQQQQRQKIQQITTTITSSASTSIVLSNVLNGTCQVGQLLQLGYNQQEMNGNVIRSTYMYDPDEKNYNNNTNRLKTLLSIYDINNIYVRSDDEQRTIMSAQAFVTGMFQNNNSKSNNSKNKDKNTSDAFSDDTYMQTIPIHTADNERDILSANDDIVCPSLHRIKKQIEHSIDYQMYLNSSEVQLIQHMMKIEFKEKNNELDMSPGSCLMPTICNDLILPDPFNDYRTPDLLNNNNSSSSSIGSRNGTRSSLPSNKSQEYYDSIYGKNRFFRVHNYYVQKKNRIFLNNNALYSKVAIGPLWLEIINNIIDNTNIPTEFVGTNYNTNNTTDNATTSASTNCINSNSSNSNSNSSSNSRRRKRNKFALFSGHDGTIVPLLASIGTSNTSNIWNVTNWPTYAAMVLIEVYEIETLQSTRTKNTIINTTKNKFMFRLLYNGQVLTRFVNGCNSTTNKSNDNNKNKTTNILTNNTNTKYYETASNPDLCDLDILIDNVHNLQKIWRDACFSNNSETSTTATTTVGTTSTIATHNRSKDNNDDTEGTTTVTKNSLDFVCHITALLVLGCTAGSIFSFCCLYERRNNNNNYYYYNNKRQSSSSSSSLSFTALPARID